MSTHTPIRGTIAPILTPFNDDGTLAHELQEKLAHEMLEFGMAGIVLFGTTGEALSVGMEERIQALRTLINSGVPSDQIIPGVGLTNIPDTMQLINTARDAGCPSGLVLPPFYFRDATEDGLYQYFAELVAALGPPGFALYLYHIPPVAGIGFSVRLVTRLREDFPEYIHGIKDSSGDWKNTQALLNIPGLAVYPGNEMHLVDAMQLGAPGCITATANVNAISFQQLLEHFDSGHLDEANIYQRATRGFRKNLQKLSPIPAMKAYLAWREQDARWINVRPPLQPAQPQVGKQVLSDFMRQLTEISRGMGDEVASIAEVEEALNRLSKL